MLLFINSQEYNNAKEIYLTVSSESLQGFFFDLPTDEYFRSLKFENLEMKYGSYENATTYSFKFWSKDLKSHFKDIPSLGCSH